MPGCATLLLTSSGSNQQTQRGLVSVKRWSNILDRGQTFDMSHLDSFDAQEQLDGRAITVRYSFWPHTFSDEKANGCPLDDERFFCRQRWEVSHEAVHFISTGKFSAGYVRVYLSKRREQQFYSLDLGHMAIFFSIHKDDHDPDTINCKVISCYPVDGTTIHKLPRGKLYKVATVYQRRLAGQTIAL